jgi:hypothetical protein
MKILFLHNYVLLGLVLVSTLISSAYATNASYDEQLGITFTQNYTSLAYNVTAVAQSSSDGYGPAYLLNGYSNTGYWYQVGISYNWGPYARGFYANYEVFSPNGQSVFPQNGGGGVLSFSGPVNQDDIILLNLYFDNGSVIMLVKDLNTGATASTSYSDEGASEFIGNSYAPEENGYFTGLMTEWYHTIPYYGNEQVVNYSIYGLTSNNGAWLWADEFYSPTKEIIFSNSTESPIFFNGKTFHEFHSNGATEYANPITFVTGNAPLIGSVTSTIMPGITNYTTTIAYPINKNSSIVNINYNITLPQSGEFSQQISLSGIDKISKLHLTSSTDIEESGINNTLNVTTTNNNQVLLALSGIGNNISIVNGNISISISGIDNIIILKNTKARIVVGISGINNTIYLINSTLVGGNIFGIGNKIISYQRGIMTFSNETNLTIQPSTTIFIPTTIPYISKNKTTMITNSNNQTNEGLGYTISSFIASIISFFTSLFNSNSAKTTIVTSTSYTTTTATTIPYTTTPTPPQNITTVSGQQTTIYPHNPSSCGNFELTINSANSSKSEQCEWSGGNLTVSDNEGQFVHLVVNVYNSTPSPNNIYLLNQSVYDNPSCITDTKSYYFPAGEYTIFIESGAIGAVCQNSYAYVVLND